MKITLLKCHVVVRKACTVALAVSVFTLLHAEVFAHASYYEKPASTNAGEVFFPTETNGNSFFYTGSAIDAGIIKQEFKVTGTVKSADDGASIPGVNIVIKGTSIGTTTDVNGTYTLNAPSGDITLVFSYIGYSTAEVAVGNRTTVDVTMETDIASLSEVVVIGYGTQKKTSVTGAISSVKSEELSVLPSVSMEQALQGRAAGVQVTNNGAPGTAPIVRIRGVGTINNANPLYVVDGVPVGEGTNIDPKDVESLEVLKDASAAAIYGSRAANGVILITTKTAKSEKIGIMIDSYIGVQTAWRKLDLLNTQQYLDYAMDLNGSLPPRVISGFDDPIYPGASQTFRQTETDWQDEMFQNAPIQQHRFEVTKGGDVSRIYISGSYFDQEGIMIGTSYKRGNMRMNSDHKISKWLTFGQTLYLTLDKRRVEAAGGSIGTNIRSIISSIPYLPVENPFNKGGYFGPQAVDASDPTQPVRNALLNQNYVEGNSIFATGYLDFRITDWLSYKFQAGVNVGNSLGSNFLPSFDSGPGGYATNPYATISQNRSTAITPIFTNQITAQKTFGKHNLNLVLVGEKQTSRWTQLSGSGQNEITDLIKIPSGVSNPSVGANLIESAILSYVARLNYEFDGKYLVGLSFRRDGSSRFAPGKKWGNFPSVSAGWRISEENFMANISTISELKLRGSYGFVGNNNIGDYQFQPTLSNNNYYEFDQSSAVQTQGYTITNLTNQDLTWETTKMLNIGLDGGLLGGKITFSAEYFNNTTEDMIVPVPIAPSSGLGSPIANRGSVRNKGFELNLGYNSATTEVKWSVNANFGTISNEVLDLGIEGATFARENWYGDNLSLTEVGQPIGYFYGWVVERIFQNQGEIDAADAVDGDAATKYQANAAPGDIKFKDLNGDGIINAEDKTQIGKYLPDFTYGVNFSANWKGFDAVLFLQGVQGNDIYTTTKYHLEGMTRLFNAGEAVLDRWTAEGQSTDVPRAVGGDPNLNSRASTRFVEDGSYFRIKNLTVGYSLSPETLGSLTGSSVSKLRLYLSTTNLLTLTKFKSGYDPEIGAFNGGGSGGTLQTGIDYGQYPQPRTITVGLQVGF